MHKELAFSWIGVITGFAIMDINVVLSILAYGTTITYTSVKLFNEFNNRKK
jgi:hypothetical protein